MFRGKVVTLHSQNGNGASLRGRPGFTGMPKDIDSDATGQRKQRGFRAVPFGGLVLRGPETTPEGRDGQFERFVARRKHKTAESLILAQDER